VNANFTVPNINCAVAHPYPQGYVAFWAGLDGYNSEPANIATVEQVGVVAECASYAGPLTINPFWAMVPSASSGDTTGMGAHLQPGTVRRGDSINVSVYYNQSTQLYQLNFTDKTTSGLNFSLMEPCPVNSVCLNQSAEAVAENPAVGGAPTFLPNFGTVAFSGVGVTSYDGTHGNLCGPAGLWTLSVNYMTAGNGNILAIPTFPSNCASPYSADSFSVQWNRSS
jgi:hypothetical protein